MFFVDDNESGTATEEDDYVQGVSPRRDRRADSATVGEGGEDLKHAVDGLLSRSLLELEKTTTELEDILDGIDKLRDRIQSVLQNRRINMQFLLWAKEKRASRDSLMEEFNTHLQSQEGTIDGMSVDSVIAASDSLLQNLNQLLSVHSEVETKNKPDIDNCRTTIWDCYNTCNEGPIFAVLQRDKTQFMKNNEADACFGQVVDKFKMIDQLVKSGRNEGGNTPRRTTRNKSSGGPPSKDSLWYVAGNTPAAVADLDLNRSSPQVEEVEDDDNDFVEIDTRKRPLKTLTSSSKKRPKRPEEKKGDGPADDLADDDHFARSVDDVLLSASNSLQRSTERPRYSRCRSDDDDAIIVSL